MTRDEVFRKVLTVLCNEFEFDPSQVVPGAHLVDDLDLDSVDAVALAVRLEEDTGLILDEEELKGLRTVADVVDAVHGRLGA